MTHKVAIPLAFQTSKKTPTNQPNETFKLSLTRNHHIKKYAVAQHEISGEVPLKARWHNVGYYFCQMLKNPKYFMIAETA